MSDFLILLLGHWIIGWYVIENPRSMKDLADTRKKKGNEYP